MQKKIFDVEYTAEQMKFLINCPTTAAVINPLKKWLPDLAWQSVQKLIEIEFFENFASDMEVQAAKRFEDWYNELTPETENLPLDWKKLNSMPFQKLLVVRCLRPDRITTALDLFIRKSLPDGDQYVDCDATSNANQILASAYGDSTPATPIFFILSPGANPLTEVRFLAKSLGMDPMKSIHSIALGQGQDVIAMDKLALAHKEGHWVFL